jgi:toxin HigB-1
MGDKWDAGDRVPTIATFGHLTLVSFFDTVIAMIVSFRCGETERLWMEGKSRRWATITKSAVRKLAMLDAAERLDDLRIPPGNRLERLKGDRAGHYAIRVNDQWRLCFRWDEGQVFDVEIVDYH